MSSITQSALTSHHGQSPSLEFKPKVRPTHPDQHLEDLTRPPRLIDRLCFWTSQLAPSWLQLAQPVLCQQRQPVIISVDNHQQFPSIFGCTSARYQEAGNASHWQLHCFAQQDDGSFSHQPSTILWFTKTNVIRTLS